MNIKNKKLTDEIILSETIPKIKEFNGIIYNENGIISHLSLTPQYQGQMIAFFETPKYSLDDLSLEEQYNWSKIKKKSFEKIINIYQKNPENIIRFYMDLYENPIIPNSKELIENVLKDMFTNGFKTPKGLNSLNDSKYFCNQKLSELHKHLIPKYFNY